MRASIMRQRRAGMHVPINSYVHIPIHDGGGLGVCQRSCATPQIMRQRFAAPQIMRQRLQLLK